MRKIKVTYPLVNYGYGAYAQIEEDRQQKWGSKLPVKITRECDYKCGESVTFTRGIVFSGSSYHDKCYEASGDKARHYEAFSKSVLGDMTPAEYQRKHGKAWNA